MADESDGVGEAFDGQIRIALAVAMQMAQRFARLREELARSAQARTEQQTRELQVRFDAERNAARASLAPLQQTEWWNTATVDDIATAYETAEGWRPVDRDMAATADRMREELRSRYGVDVDNMGPDPVVVREAMTRAEQDRALAAQARGESAAGYAEASVLLANAERLDWQAQHDRGNANMRYDEEHPDLAREEMRLRGLARDEEIVGGADLTIDERMKAEHRFADSHELGGEPPETSVVDAWARDEARARVDAGRESVPDADYKSSLAAAVDRREGGLAYDSAERRGSFAAEMEKAGVSAELQRTRLTADLDNGTHPSAAVAQKVTRQQKRRGVGQKPGMQRERGGLSQ